MPSFGQYPQRDFSPVDVCDVRFESPRSSHSRLLAKPLRESDEEKGHQYEDPSTLCDQVRVLQGGEKRPRKRYNDMYEPHIPLKEINVRRAREASDCSDLSDTYTRESCLNRCILFFVLLTSVTALILVILLMLGKVGPVVERCSCANAEQGNAIDATPRGEQLGGSDNTEETKNIVAPSPPDISSLENVISELKRNISLIKKSMNTLRQDIEGTKGDLNDANRNINGTKDQLSQIESGTQNSIRMIQNISQQLDASVSAINVSFLQELDSVRTSFDSKLNNTAQNLSDADSSLQTLLNTINSSLMSQVQSISKLRGPTGHPGFNGSQGDSGPQGTKGQKGEPGQAGSNGGPGPKGDPGISGTDGVAGQQGNIGPKGDKGEPGTPGQQGPQGPAGPQGPQGAGNFSQCVYRTQQSTGTADGDVIKDVVEQANQKFLGVTCSTTHSAEYNLSVLKRLSDNLFVFTCTCKGKSTLFTVGSSSTACIIHYWECPLTT